MRRIILLALLALALPTAALANSFDFPSGNFVSGTTSGAPVGGSTLTVSLVGTTNTISIVTGTLTMVTSTIFTFNSGTVSVPTQGAGFQNLKLFVRYTGPHGDNVVTELPLSIDPTGDKRIAR